jgi:hypothetical protein
VSIVYSSTTSRGFFSALQGKAHPYPNWRIQEAWQYQHLAEEKLVLHTISKTLAKAFHELEYEWTEKEGIIKVPFRP